MRIVGLSIAEHQVIIGLASGGSSIGVERRMTCIYFYF